ncbi:MAG: flagellar basal body P-ring protein FlgI [Candidatus Krumholzibacteriia bacterium]
MRRATIVVTIVILAVATLLAGSAKAEAESRIKDLARLEGTSSEPLVGYGIVVGLGGTGDGQGSESTLNSLSAMLERLGLTVDPEQLKMKNVAAVLVTAQLDPGVAVGSRVNVTVSSIGDASSLEGGQLVMTPLLALDGTVVVVAQGSVSIGGFNIKSGANNSFRKNHATVGLVPGGGTVKRLLPSQYISGGRVAWLLHHPDFSTAANVANSINAIYGESVARASTAQRIEVTLPPAHLDEPVAFIAAMSELRTRSDAAARVVINERTGTIIVGANVVLKEAAVAHGTLKVTIKTWYDVSQPAPFSPAGRTVVTPDVQTQVDDREAQVLRIPETSTVADVVGVLNDIGASPRDIIAILEALKQAGALQAELVVL